MVYAGEAKGQRATFGVSGRLDRRNLVMWDEESNSLWSQILGVAQSGARKGQRLRMAPAVFVPLESWVRVHPQTKVLDLSKVRATPWHFTGADFLRGRVGPRAGGDEIGIGLREGEDRLVVPMRLLHEHDILEVELGERALALVWLAKARSALVYERPGPLVLTSGGTLIEAEGKRSWDALSGRSADPGGKDLRRFPYIPTYLRAWKTYYPKTRKAKARASTRPAGDGR